MHIIDVETRHSPTIVSVLDHGAFAAKHIPLLGHAVMESKVFHWKVQGWKELDKKLTSPEFSCGGHKWRTSLLPSGPSDAPLKDIISVHLHNSSLGGGWHACAKFVLVISNPHNPTIYNVAHGHHRFTVEEDNWTTTLLGDLPKLSQPQPGHNRPTIEGDSAVVSVYMRVLEDPTGVLWHDFVNYNSKKETGYVGLKNQGTTGRMNTILQSLFCIGYFRKAVYQIPTEDQSPTESVPLALQRVFYNLQTSDRPAETTELTGSFPWKPLDSFSQCDVREFNRVLQDKLESLTKGTPAEGVISKLFAGRMKSLIKSISVDDESPIVEEFHDLQLNVKGIKTLYDSFQDYVAGGTLDGRLAFQSLPPVLHLLLKRYEPDVQCDAMAKITDRFEFPFEIDLDDFLDDTAERTESWKYKLHSVLVHSGDLHSGQYIAFIKPDRHNRWLKFDDERVTPVTDREVLEESYGGEPLRGVVSQTQWNRISETRKSANAHMLVYIRETAIDEVMAPVTHEDVPLYLWHDEERAEMEAKKEEREAPYLFMAAKVITDETFSRHEGFDLASFDGTNSPISDLPTFLVRRVMTYSAFKSRVARRFGHPESQIRLWVLVGRKNGTVRPDTHIPMYELTVESIYRNLSSIRYAELRLYLDVPSDPSLLDHAGMMIVFLKHFNTTRQTLFGIGNIYVRRTDRVRDLIPIITDRMKWSPEKQLKLYEEIKPGMIELMKPSETFAKSEIQDGDIICFQVDISEQEAEDFESRGLSSNPQQFYKSLQSRR